MRSPCCLCVYVSPHQSLNVWTYLYETWYVYHGTWAYLNGVYLYVYPPIVTRQPLGKHVSETSNTRNRIIVGHVVFCVVRVVSKNVGD
jgi:hypothetical protein